ncbi:hypothetical protein COCOBI_06-3760 [Coccomyxa sp. Obi]|nr:hypothetical protein COCOBI_06-3760 [Coccomyxa sp. Obi]
MPRWIRVDPNVLRPTHGAEVCLEKSDRENGTLASVRIGRRDGAAHRVEITTICICSTVPTKTVAWTVATKPQSKFLLQAFTGCP